MTFRVPTRDRLGLLEDSIRQLPSVMARLATLASLRDPNTGVYSHHVAGSPTEKAAVAALLKHLHEQAFGAWLRCRLEEQEADLELYFSCLSCSRERVLKTWLDLQSYRCFVPASGTAAERLLFTSNMEALLRMMSGSMRGLALEAGPSGDTEPLLTTREVSKKLHVSPRALRLWSECGEIPAMKVGREWRFRCGEVAQWLEARKGNGP